MNALARRLGCTEGQAYSLLITMSLVLLLTVGGVVPVLRFTPRLQAIEAPRLTPNLSPSTSPSPTAVATPAPAPTATLPVLAQLPVAPPVQITQPPQPSPGPTPTPVDSGGLPPVPIPDLPVLVQAGWSGPLNDGTSTPAGDLGLGNQLVLGQTISYFEIAWRGSSVSLAFDVDANINKDTTLASAQICPITAKSWNANAGGTTGPAYDCSHAVPVVLTVSGFALDLRRIPASGAFRSFALVPTGSKPFQVALRKRVFP